MKSLNSLLKNKKVLLAVTGSISAYKSVYIARLLIRHGAEVKVVMSESAKRFITPLTFEAITQNEVLSEATESWSSETNHIACARWADLLLIAPATANTINKLSNGIADNLLLQTALAFSGKKILAPAANTNMIANPITEASIKLLKLNGFEIVKSESGYLACGENANGRLASEERIFLTTAKSLLEDDFWSYRGVVISGGGTEEKIDDVRVLSNNSSGKMAVALATASYLLGADVCLVGTAKADDLPIHTIEAKTADEMLEALDQSIREAKKGVMPKASLIRDDQGLISKKPVLFMAAAVSDYKAKYPQSGKLKKDVLGDEWDLKLIKNSDILNQLDKNGIYSVGFKAEFDKENALKNAEDMKNTKNLDAVCLNILGTKEADFGSDQTKITMTTNERNDFEGDKLAVAFEILNKTKESMIDS